jgi:hypothetical protein
MNAKKGFFIGLMFAFFVLGLLSMQRAMPAKKEKRIYDAVKVYMPFKLEKNMGGLNIIDTRDGTKEKPDAASVYHRLDELEQEWGKQHLKVEANDLVVVGDNNQTIVKIFIQTPEEREWIKTFFGI